MGSDQVRILYQRLRKQYSNLQRDLDALDRILVELEEMLPEGEIETSEYISAPSVGVEPIRPVKRLHAGTKSV